MARTPSTRLARQRKSLPRLVLASLGVVFGDIATSPLYTVPSIFTGLHGESRIIPAPDDLRGGLCCIVWLITAVIAVKYITLLMGTGSFHGEGGTFALLNNLKSCGALEHRRRTWRFFQLLAMACAALIIADGLLTPVVTVTSAIEGIGLSVWRFNGSKGTISLDTGKQGWAGNFRTSCTVSAAVLVLIFALQAAGSQRIGTLYSPIIISWLLFIGVAGARRCAESGGSIFAAWSPWYLVHFWRRSHFRGLASWHSLGGIFLSVTGAEALFADQGHFSASAIALAWFVLVYPCLLLSYTGQVAWLLSHGDLTDPLNASLCFSLDNEGLAAPGSGTPPFATYLSFPSPQRLCTAEGFVGKETGASGPAGLLANVFWWSTARRFGSRTYQALLVVATLASIVGSQALISGCFTILDQAAKLGLFSQLRVIHTSALYEHQIVMPAVNLILCAFCLVFVGAFQHASNLIAVYGACVSTAMLLDSVLYAGVAHFALRLPLLAVAAIVLPLLIMDGSLATANLAKYFISGPVALSYPSDTAAILQAQEQPGRLGPVPQNAWVAMLPLAMAAFIFLSFSAWAWGRRKAMLDTARTSALLFKVGGADHVAEATPAGSLPDSETTVSPHLLRSELAQLAGRGGPDALKLRHCALTAALTAFADNKGGLLRPPAAGLFLHSAASYWDTEPVPPPDDEHSLTLPEALLRTLLAVRALPALTVILDIRFPPGVAIAPRRLEVRPVGTPDAEAAESASPLGIYHVILRYGFAEHPTRESDVPALLRELGEAHSALAALRHVACSAGHCRVAGAQACVPVTFFVARESLEHAGLLEALPTALYNLLLGMTQGSKFAFLGLPLTEVMELGGHIDLRKLRDDGL